MPRSHRQLCSVISGFPAVPVAKISTVSFVLAIRINCHTIERLRSGLTSTPAVATH